VDQESLILNLATEGLRAKKIASSQGFSIATVVDALAKAMEERRIKRSQVLSSLEEVWQKELAIWAPAWNRKPRKVSLGFIHEMLRESNLDASDVERICRAHQLGPEHQIASFDLGIEELGLYLLCFEKPFRDGEVYEALCEIERTLHAKVKAVLIENYGPHPSGWWRKGVLKDVRKKCVEEWEDEPDFVEYPPYHKTTLGQLQQIIQSAKDSKHPKKILFQARLPVVQKGRDPDMEVFKKEFSKLVSIRNKVMHPIGATPLNEDDLFFVKEMQAKLDVTKWRK
jgi:hypothetical protein